MQTESVQYFSKVLTIPKLLYLILFVVIIILVIIYFKEILHYHTKQKGKKRSLQDIKERPLSSSSSSWSVDIPNELLLEIFWHGVRSFGAIPFLCRYNYCV